MNMVEGSLKENIALKIEEIRVIENKFPGAIIIHDLEGKVVYMSKWGRDYLGTTNEQLRDLGMEYYARFFNGEDANDYVPNILGLLERNNDDEFIYICQPVRKSPSHDRSWYIRAVKIFIRDESGKPLLTLTQALPVDAQHHIAVKAQRLLEENEFLRKNYQVFDQLTKREKEIL